MRPIRWLRRGIMLAGLGAAGGALFITARHLLETPQPLQSALGGESRIDRKHGGDIYYNVAGDASADPLVLLHDFYLGASNYEYRHIFPRLATTWRVYAPDWLGFGMSEHPPLAYTGEFYANTLIGFLRDVVERPAVVVAHGRAANIAARAAADAPDLFSRLVLVSPDVAAGIEIEPKPSQLLVRATQRLSLGLVPYAFLSMRPLLRQLAHRRSAFSGEVSANEDTVSHLYASTHQFGGQHAQLALMTGELDLPIQNLFPLLQPSVLLVSGDEDPSHPVSEMEDLAVLNPHADLDVLSSAGAAVFEDQPAMFTEVLLDWLATTPAPQQPQVEERHPASFADALAAAPEPIPEPIAETVETPADIEVSETIVLVEPVEGVEEEGVEEAGAADTSAPATPGTEKPGNAPGPTAEAAEEPTSKPARKSTRKAESKSARRSASASVSAPASSPARSSGKKTKAAASGETKESAPAKRTTRRARETSENPAARTNSDSSATGKTTRRDDASRSKSDKAKPSRATRNSG